MVATWQRTDTGYTGVEPTEEWAREVRRLLDERDAVLLAHNYQLPEIQDLCRALLRETVAVGVAVGAQLDESDVDRVMRTYQSYPDDNGTSMYYDRMAGRPLEHDLLSGAVVRAAAEHQVSVPANLAVWALSRTCA